MADKVVAALPADWAVDSVAEVVTLLYAQATSTVGELVDYAADPTANRYRAQVEEINGAVLISCGPNPFLIAERVVELVVEKDSASGREVITWARMEADGVTPGRRHTFLRVVEGPPRSEVVRGRGLRGKQPRAGG
ncbi:MAG TPA: hypothetical protein VF615_21440 [Longimicrobiaceae bacterium]|jgi:hypothetical protein